MIMTTAISKNIIHPSYHTLLSVNALRRNLNNQDKNNMAMKPKTFEKYRILIYDYSGISLKDGKRTMLESRINKRIRALDLPSYEAYFDYVNNDKHEDELVNMIDEVSTNITHFFQGCNALHLPPKIHQ